jgi:hypothetical protein
MDQFASNEEEHLDNANKDVAASVIPLTDSAIPVVAGGGGGGASDSTTAARNSTSDR